MTVSRGRTGPELMFGLFNKNGNRDIRDNTNRYINLIRDNPLDPELHFKYGIHCFEHEQFDLGSAELRTSATLGMEKGRVNAKIGNIKDRFCDIRSVNHNRYYRMKSITDAVNLAASMYKIDKNTLSVLDIGGGDGLLNRMIPDSAYFLADPATNGISALDLPFTGKPFDIVVANHVLEHIHVSRRIEFLDSLCGMAKKEVILLSPFYIENTYVRERLTLFLKITGAEWAREHLEAGMPLIEEIRDYANSRNLDYTIQANGTMAVTMAIEYADYFAGKAGCQQSMAEINSFYNEKISGILDSEKYPNAYLIRLMSGK